jgi:hypothetical protein
VVGEELGLTGMGAHSPVRDAQTRDRLRDERPRLIAHVRRVLPALATFAAVRVVSVLSYVALTAALGRYAHRSLFTAVDGGWYRLIALHGYDLRAAAPYHGSVFGFFPLYPALMHLGSVATGLGVDAVGLAVTWAAGLAAAWALYETGRLLASERAGLLLAAMWALAPSAFAEASLYADTLAIALSAWALYALLRRRWLIAGTLAALAGLTRPTAAAVEFVVLVASALALARRTDGWRPLGGLLTAPLGSAAFFIYVALRVGDPTGYFEAQRLGWGSRFDGGASTAHRVLAGLTGAHNYHTAAAVISTTVLLTVPVLIAVQIRQRQPWEFVLYTVAAAGSVYGVVHLYTTSPRELLPLYPLLLPGATLLARVSDRRILIATFAILAVASGWYASYVPVMTGVIP